jgi:serine/threonine protein kinase
MWAIGIILYQLLSKGKHPFEGDNYFDVMKSIGEDQPDPLPVSVSPFMKETVIKLLDKNPETRPDALTLLKIE